MKPIAHPSHFISCKWVDTFRQLAVAADQAGELQPDQLSTIYDEQWFNMFVSTNHQGLALTLPDGLKIEEALAWADGSLGWVVTLCSGAAWFSGFLQPDIAKLLFTNDKVCFAGSGQPSGIATVIENGYEINGHWNYATGAPHATVFTANCIVAEKKGVRLKNEDGTPVIYSFLFMKDEVTQHKDWHSTGLVATASHSFTVKQLQVSPNRCFRIDSSFAVSKDPIYQYPFLQFAEATLAINSSGMAVHFMDLCDSLVFERSKQNHYPAARISTMHQQLDTAKKALDQYRQEFYNAITASWNECVTKKIVSKELLGAVSTVSRTLAIKARGLVNELYPYCGLVAANRDSELNRVWRDMHTASQHPLLIYENE